MALAVWFREDLYDALLGMTVAALGAALASGRPDPSYVRGLLDAARSACVAFGVAWAPFVADLRALLASSCVLDVLEGAGVRLAAPGGALQRARGR